MISLPQQILEIALPVPLHRTFDYLCPESLSGDVAVGCRARVEFGTKRVVGLVVGIKPNTTVPANKLKAVLEKIDASPLPDALDMKLVQWVVSYYHAPPGEMLTLLFPGSMRRGDPLASASLPELWSRKSSEDAAVIKLLARAPKQRALWAVIASLSSPFTRETALLEAGEGYQQAWRELCAKDVVFPAPTSEPLDDNTNPSDSASHPFALDETAAKYPLNFDQEAAIKTILAKTGGFSSVLLDGVTGSGKTEVYLQIAADVLRQGRQVLMLVPEIGLIAQLVGRVRRRFGITVDVYHSDLTDKERQRVWRRGLKKESRIVVGTRSSLFLPMPDLGLLIVDEEHDLSYKQQESVRYSARDVAIRRAQLRDIPVILGSATPSLESLANVERGRYLRVPLPKRVTKRAMPEVLLIDTRGIPTRDGLSPKLIEAMQEHLAAGSQILLFLNRRGYAPVIYCADCGWVASCTRCSSRLTYHHKFNRLRCHYCGTDKSLLSVCPDCKGERLMPVGKGTERVELALKACFPDKNVARIDRDTARSSKVLEEMMAKVRGRETDILIGTQMLAKGHHLPGIGLAAIVDMDTALYSLDYRALERAGQMITQVFGRSGRGESRGQVIIQTSCPEHPALDVLLRHGYAVFAHQILAERRAAHLPPYYFQAAIRAEAHVLMKVEQFLQHVQQRVRAMGIADVDLFGPMAGTLEKCAGYYRRVLILQCQHRPPLHACLAELVRQLDTDTTIRQVRWHIDVDPQELG